MVGRTDGELLWLLQGDEEEEMDLVTNEVPDARKEGIPDVVADDEGHVVDVDTALPVTETETMVLTVSLADTVREMIAEEETTTVELM
jgi:hypothetical protein